jgi:hypothetical protein
VISVGPNSHSHPAPETLTRLAAQNVQVWRTDQRGSILVSSDGFSVTFPDTGSGHPVYLPLVMRFDQPPPAPDVRITAIFANGTGTAEPDEYVQFQNFGQGVVQLQSWTLRDNTNHVYTFPNFALQPGQVCRVYTNLNDPSSCGFNYASGSSIWNNSGDCAHLRNAQGQEVSQFCD